ncbi:MAG: glycosyltransferase [Bacteroidales bacterium]|nr:glycosyltransferase [Bacteroidales bacterium]
MRIVHLTSSTLFGGPERQMLGLAEHLPADWRTFFLSFAEGGRCQDFLHVVRERGFDALALHHDTPHLRSALRELTQLLRQHAIDAVLCHGYKANLLGRIAARRLGIPAVAVSRGWTGENRKVRVYEALDRRHLRFMDHVVAVSEGQAAKVRRCRVPERKLTVIRNSARLAAFTQPDPTYRERLAGLFPVSVQNLPLVLAAGRLSPEKGFDVLVQAASQVLNARFVLFGEGTERLRLEQLVSALGLSARFQMPGFTAECDRFLPWADLFVLPSHTEGLPNVALEASSAGVPVVATAVGGTPEVVADDETGFLVPPAQPDLLATRIREFLADAALRQRMGAAGRRRMQERFTFSAQADAYIQLLTSLQPTAVIR